MKNEDFGEAAEADFQALCKRSGIECTPTGRDVNGWDVLLEFGTGEQGVNVHKSKFAVLIQVKGTRTNDASVRLKLSTARKAVSLSLPFFVVVLRYDKGREELGPTGINVVHVGAELSTEILKKYFQEKQKSGRAGKKFAPGKKKFRIRLPDKIWPVSAEFLGSITNEIGDYHDYLQARAAHLQRTGSPQSTSLSVNVDMKQADLLRKMEDQQLGHDHEPIEVLSGSQFSQRFGIRDFASESDVGFQRFLLGKTAQPVRYEFSGGTLAETICLEGQFSVSRSMIQAGIEPSRVRMECPFFDITVSISDKRCRGAGSYSWMDKPMVLDDLNKVLMLLKNACRKDTIFEVRIVNENGRSISGGTLDYPDTGEELSKEVAYLRSLHSKLKVVAGLAEFPAGTLFTMQRLHEQRENLFEAFRWATGRGLKSFDVNWGEKPPAEVDGAGTAIIRPFPCTFPVQTIGFIVRISGVASLEKGSIVVRDLVPIVEDFVPGTQDGETSFIDRMNAASKIVAEQADAKLKLPLELVSL